MKDGVEDIETYRNHRAQLDAVVRILRGVAADLGGDKPSGDAAIVPIEELVREDAIEVRMLVPGASLSVAELRAAFDPGSPPGAGSPVAAALATCRELVSRSGGVFSIENATAGLRVTVEVPLR